MSAGGSVTVSVELAHVSGPVLGASDLAHALVAYLDGACVELPVMTPRARGGATHHAARYRCISAEVRDVEAGPTRFPHCVGCGSNHSRPVGPGCKGWRPERCRDCGHTAAEHASARTSFPHPVAFGFCLIAGCACRTFVSDVTGAAAA